MICASVPEAALLGSLPVFRHPRAVREIRLGKAQALSIVSVKYLDATGALALNKTSALLMIPKGFVCTGIRFRIGDADSGGSPAVVFKLGDSGDDDRLVTANTSAQAGGEVTALADAGFLYEYTADTELLWTTSTAA